MTVKKILPIIILVLFNLFIGTGAVSGSNSCGENVSYAFDATSGTLHISGTGKMQYTECPWYSEKDSIKTVIIANGVTEICWYAFSEHRNLISVSIPSTVKSIGWAAFYGCSNLTTITIPEGVTSIDDQAFYNCRSLKNVEIPDSVTSIGRKAFYNCIALTEVTIPKNVTKIEDEVFSMCSSLENVVIKYGVADIGNETFNRCSSLKNITIPDSVVSIGYAAFKDCTGLENVNFSNGLKHIGGAAFSMCGNLTRVDIPESVTSIGESAFFWCTKLESVTIPDGIVSISDQLFYSCYNLTNAKIPESVTSIGNNAFYDCGNLVDINIPDAVTRIGDSAFGRTGYAFDYNNWENDMLYFGKYFLEALEVVDGRLAIKPGTVAIAGGAFANCRNLTGVVIPDSVKSIGERAFFYCLNLTDIVIPDGVTKIEDKLFGKCISLTSVVIPDSVKSIGEDVFFNCSNKEFTIYGFLGSVTEEYAGISGLTFKSVDEVVYTITYDANGGENAPNAVKKGHNSDACVSDEVPTKQHSSFAGWALTPNGDVVYMPGDKLDINANAILYARWNNPTITVGNASGGTGRIVRVPVSISRNPGITLLEIYVVYDNQTITLIGVEDTGVIGTLNHSGDLMDMPPYTLSWDNTNVGIIKSDGTIATLVFKIKETAQAGKSDVVVIINGIVSGQNIDFDSMNGIIEIKDMLVGGIIGDITGDDVINIQDVIRLLKHINNSNPINDTSYCDINSDGRVNIQDVIRLLKHVNNSEPLQNV